MNNQQDDSNTSAYPPAADTMDSQTAQADSTFNWESAINDIIKGPHREPWIPIVGQQQSRNNASNSWQALMNYREPGIMSEDGTMPDSVPAELHFAYVDENTSFAGGEREAAAGATQMQRMLSNVQIGNLGPHMPSMRDTAMDAVSNFSTTTAAAGRYVCSHCNRECKSQSNLKKHELTHSRPHLCNYPNCNKAMEGFSTPNDLQRHKASVHKEASVGYKCPHEDCSRVSEPKIWPRKDNFRTHLLKVHGTSITADDADAHHRIQPMLVAERMTPSKHSAQFEDVASHMDAPLAGANSHGADSAALMDTDQPRYENQQATNPIIPGVSYYPAYDADAQIVSQHPPFHSTGDQVDVSFGTESAQSLQGHQTQSFDSQSFATQPMALGPDVFGPPINPGYNVVQSSQPRNTNAVDETQILYSPRTSSVFSAPRGSFTVASSQATNQTIEAFCHDDLVNQGYTQSEIMTCLGTFPVELLEQALRAKTHSSRNSNEPEDIYGNKTRYPCSQCDKVCNRACELKKHMKRHDRPYGCTVKDCGKSFGSKNDWKRHESGQHASVEAWGCDEDGCVAVFDSRIKFLSHLREAHDTIPEADHHLRVQSCQIGLKSDARFWCGFCKRVVEIDEAMMQEDGSTGTHWTRRFDHIDNHLFGKGGLAMKSKSQWRFLEDVAEGAPRRRADQMSTTASVRSTTTSNGASYKRKGSEQTDSRPRKRADGQWAASSR